jgi:predicted nucleic acid-binding protein
VIVLDTNVVSELMRTAPELEAVRWVDAFDPTDVFITAVTAAELVYGVARLPEGRRKERLSVTVSALVADDFADQVLPFDGLAAVHYADIVVFRQRLGRPISMAAAQTAAICRHWSAGMATRNVSDFTDTGIHVVDPWEIGGQ